MYKSSRNWTSIFIILINKITNTTYELPIQFIKMVILLKRKNHMSTDARASKYKHVCMKPTKYHDSNNAISISIICSTNTAN